MNPVFLTPASRVEFYSTGTLAGADMADARSVGSRVASIPCTCRICALVSIVPSRALRMG